MGIKGLSGFLRKKHRSVFEPHTPEQMRGWLVAVDVPIYAYRFVNSEGITEASHLADAFLRFDENLVYRGIRAIYIFDGDKFRAAKHHEHERRAEAFGEQKHRAQRANAACDAALLETPSYDPAHPMACFERHADIEKQRRREPLQLPPGAATVLEERLRAAGRAVLVASGEAEQTGSFLSRIGLCDAVMTDDLDALPFRCSRVVRFFGRADQQIIHTERVVASLDLTHPQFVDFCILCGTDFSGKLPSIGPVRALQNIRKYQNLDRFWARTQNVYTEEIQSHFTFHVARSIFLGNVSFRDCPTWLSLFLCASFLRRLLPPDGVPALRRDDMEIDDEDDRLLPPDGVPDDCDPVLPLPRTPEEPHRVLDDTLGLDDE